MRAITVCVDYDDIFRLVLPSWVDKFTEIWVVTSTQDDATQRLVESQDGTIARLIATDAFTRNGDTFNKGAALSEGMGAMGMHGWIAVMDADIVLPESLQAFEPSLGFLYSPYRRMAPLSLSVPPERKWGQLPLGEETLNHEYAGYCQVFHGLDPAVPDYPPLYPTNWPTARGCDTDFWKRWPADRLLRPEWEVLHIGETRQNWSGRTTPRLATASLHKKP